MCIICFPLVISNSFRWHRQYFWPFFLILSVSNNNPVSTKCHFLWNKHNLWPQMLYFEGISGGWWHKPLTTLSPKRSVSEWSFIFCHLLWVFTHFLVWFRHRFRKKLTLCLPLSHARSLVKFWHQYYLIRIRKKCHDLG